MRGKTVLLILVLAGASCDALLSEQSGIEARGKKKKIALFVYFADIIIKKIFVLKLIYAFVFWLVLHKAGYFLGWFASYLKEKKQEFPQPQYGPPQYSYGPPQSSYGPPQYGDSYGPYRSLRHFLGWLTSYLKEKKEEFPQPQYPQYGSCGPHRRHGDFDRG